uniref:Protein inturned n=1 Tax=Hippocampus comes TaxID=109280 RepID=A0A3Q2Y9B1_HIPCM
AVVRSTLARISGRKRRESRNRGGAREDSMPWVSAFKTQLKTVLVYLNPKRLGGSAALPLLESLLGVLRLPCQPDGASVGREGRLTVDGLIPGSPASKCGDVLVAVDDVEVSSENIEQVLASVLGPTQVRLTLATSTNPGGASGPGCPAMASVPVVPPVRPLPGEDACRPRPVGGGGVPHAVMYLSLQMDAKSPRDEEEILYQYPASEAAARLKGARGIFMTLCDMLDSVTGGRVVSTLLLPDKHLVHVGYWKEGDALLVVGLPAEVPLPCLQTLVGDAVRTLRVMYGSLAAFGRTEHTPQLDRFFRLFFLRLMRPSDSPLAPPTDNCRSIFLDGLPALRWLLIANHLPQEDLLDACLYMRHHDPPPPAASRRSVGQTLVWREVFLQRSRPGRHFLLIVALTAALLRLETLEEAVEERLSAAAAPRLFCADWFPQALSAGAESVLFHYVLVETVRGIFIAPTPTEEAQLGGSIPPSLIGNFYRCCLSIRALFKENTPEQERPRGASRVKEHGVLFQHVPENGTSSRKAAPTLTYWVIRLLPEPVPQEVYVCFHDSVPPAPVETAFRLSFGLVT